MRTLGGRYRLINRIGLGGMSEVWRGHDCVLDRPVAVKIMAPGVEGSLGIPGVDLIRAEARSAARLAHPNVAGVHDFGTSPGPSATPRPSGSPAAGGSSGPGGSPGVGGSLGLDGSPGAVGEVPYIVMELVEGQTLSEHLAAGHLDWRISVRVCAEVAAALAAAHAENVVHRDIKPANIMLTPAGAKVLDFGIAATVGSPDPDPDGPVMGTPAYIAPERFDGLPATPAADMFALGTLLYHCLAGRLPWTTRSHTELVLAQRFTDPEPLPPLDDLPTEVLDLVSRCLARDPAERPTALVAALLLAEAVDARVYVPLGLGPGTDTGPGAGLTPGPGLGPGAGAGLGAPAPSPRRPSSRSPWNERAAAAPTSAAPAVTHQHPASAPGDLHVGRHRAT